MDFNYVVMPMLIVTAGVLIIWLSVRRMRSLSAKTYGTWRKFLERTVLATIVVLAVVIAGSTSFNAVAVHHFWAIHPAPGKIVRVDGHKMHIYCMGSGSPTIVLEAGGQNDSVIWRGVQPSLSETTRVCAYDRAGFGWSDPQPGPRDADDIAAELHQLLLQTGIIGPIVLMGHSIGGIFLRDYVTHYPANVAGIVFIDSSTPFQDKNPAMKLGSSGPPSWVFNLAMIVGVPRLIGMCGSMRGVEDHTKKLRAESICRLHNSAFAEVDSFDLSSQETLHSGPYRALPILIISHDPQKQLPTKPSQRDLDRQNAWSQMQEDLKKLSTHSRRIIAKDSVHSITLDRPDLIEKEVPLFIEQIRGSAPQPTNYGSTVTE